MCDLYCPFKTKMSIYFKDLFNGKLKWNKEVLKHFLIMYKSQKEKTRAFSFLNLFTRMKREICLTAFPKNCFSRQPNLSVFIQTRANLIPAKSLQINYS